jgi:lysophospholipase L1-like esterase
MDRCGNRVNSSIASFLMKNYGSYIRYPEIKANEKFFEDGVHLSSLGNEHFLNTLQGGIESIVENWSSSLTFPNSC